MDTPIFSQEQVSKIFDELQLKPQPPNPAEKKPAPAAAPDPRQSVEDILKNHFIEEEPA
ncbi:MAG: hypothetical protein LBQ83_08110 [Candidatus Margulisbacteria bacterium]|jgi:hypothetical protein|nr:hypothetical protein [Candidatus Margulisiibacteriota bacterium]